MILDLIGLCNVYIDMRCLSFDIAIVWKDVESFFIIFICWYNVILSSTFNSYWCAVNSCDSFVQDSLCMCIHIEIIDGASMLWIQYIQHFNCEQCIFKIAGSLKRMEWKIMCIILFAVSKEGKYTVIFTKSWNQIK